MPDSVRLTDGVEFTLASGATVACDARSPSGDVNVLSHAHGDHLFDAAPTDPIVCSETTAALATARRDLDQPLEAGRHPAVTLHDSGHVPGSRAALIVDGDTRFLYTGDVSTRDRLFLAGYDPVPADVLVVESTYGRPEYVFPDQAECEAAILDWLADTADVPVLLFGYTLGRAQELTALANRSVRDTVYVSDAVATMNDVVARELGVGDNLDAEAFDGGASLGPGDAVVLPSQTRRLSFVDAILDRTDAVTAGFSGWAVETSYRYRGDFDETFVLSDHCDYRELLELVDATDPDQVYTQHGFADDFADHVTAELGIPAQSLKKNQATLGDF